MPRPPKTFHIPLYNDIKCIKTLLGEGYTTREIAEYYDIPRGALSRYIKKMKEESG